MDPFALSFASIPTGSLMSSQTKSVIPSDYPMSSHASHGIPSDYPMSSHASHGIPAKHTVWNRFRVDYLNGDISSANRGVIQPLTNTYKIVLCCNNLPMLPAPEEDPFGDICLYQENYWM